MTGLTDGAHLLCSSHTQTQVRKLNSVLEAEDLTKSPFVQRELMLIKARRNLVQCMNVKRML